MTDAPREVLDLAEERAERRAAKDFAGADELRGRIAGMGWSVVDEPDGWRLEPVAVSAEDVRRPIRAHDVGSVLDEPATADVSIHWVVEGWPLDVRRAIDSFRANAGGRDVHYVVADVTGDPDAMWGDDVEVVQLEPGTGWGAARNAGLRRSRGRIVLAMDGSVEATGDVFGPLEAALADPTVGVCGPFGIVTPDLREFDATEGPEADAIEGYCMAFRREILTAAGLFDEKFRWYRTADIEYSFRIKDLGSARWSFPFRWSVTSIGCGSRRSPRIARGGRSGTSTGSSIGGATGIDLTVSGEPPPGHDHEHDEHHDHDDHGPSSEMD